MGGLHSKNWPTDWADRFGVDESLEVGVSLFDRPVKVMISGFPVGESNLGAVLDIGVFYQGQSEEPHHSRGRENSSKERRFTWSDVVGRIGPRVVYYHHPEAENLSLVYSSADPHVVEDRQRELDGSTKIIEYPFDEPVYVLYQGNMEIESAAEIDYTEDWLTNRVSSLERSGEVVAFRLVELLQAAVDASESAEFRLYKEFEPQRIQEAIENVSWERTLPRVAGELMSNLILRHSLPNANHRTGIAMLQFCIESVDPSFEMPRTHLDDDTWREWVDPYIVESKRLITVRRNNVRFKRLESAGVDIVERKDGIQIVLAEFELDLRIREAQTEYAERHESHCTEFARILLEESDQTDLLDRNGPAKADFIECLESGLVERDFRELS